MYNFDEICVDKQFGNAVAQIRETMFAVTRFSHAVLNRQVAWQVAWQDAVKAMLNNKSAATNTLMHTHSSYMTKLLGSPEHFFSSGHEWNCLVWTLLHLKLTTTQQYTFL